MSMGTGYGYREWVMCMGTGNRTNHYDEDGLNYINYATVTFLTSHATFSTGPKGHDS